MFINQDNRITVPRPVLVAPIINTDLVVPGEQANSFTMCRSMLLGAIVLCVPFVRNLVKTLDTFGLAIFMYGIKMACAVIVRCIGLTTILLTWKIVPSIDKGISIILGDIGVILQETLNSVISQSTDYFNDILNYRNIRKKLNTKDSIVALNLFKKILYKIRKFIRHNRNIYGR